MKKTQRNLTTQNYDSLKKKKKLIKSLTRKNHLKKPRENSVEKLSELVNKEDTDLNWGLFQKHFKFTKSSALLRELYRIKSKK